MSDIQAQEAPTSLINRGKYDYLEWVLRAVLKNLHASRGVTESVLFNVPGVSLPSVTPGSFAPDYMMGVQYKKLSGWLEANQNLSHLDEWALGVRVGPKDLQYRVMNVAECALPMEVVECAGYGKTLGARELLAVQGADKVAPAKNKEARLFASQSRPFWRPFMIDESSFMIYAPSNLYYSQYELASVGYCVVNENGVVVPPTDGDNSRNPHTMVFTTEPVKVGAAPEYANAPMVVPYAEEELVVPQDVVTGPEPEIPLRRVDECDVFPLSDTSLFRRWNMPPLVLNYRDARDGRTKACEIFNLPSLLNLDGIPVDSEVIDMYLSLSFLRDIHYAAQTGGLPPRFGVSLQELEALMTQLTGLGHYGALPGVLSIDNAVQCINLWVKYDGSARYTLGSAPDVTDVQWMKQWKSLVDSIILRTAMILDVYDALHNRFVKKQVANAHAAAPVPLWGPSGYQSVDNSAVVALLWTVPVLDNDQLPTATFLTTLNALFDRVSSSDLTSAPTKLSYSKLGGSEVTLTLTEVDKTSIDKVDAPVLSVVTSSGKPRNVAIIPASAVAFDPVNAVLPQKPVINSDVAKVVSKVYVVGWSDAPGSMLSEYDVQQGDVKAEVAQREIAAKTPSVRGLLATMLKAVTATPVYATKLGSYELSALTKKLSSGATKIAHGTGNVASAMEAWGCKPLAF